MALPATLNPAAPLNSDSPGQGDDQLRALKQLIADLFGLSTDPTPLTAAPFSITAAGVVTVSQGFTAGGASAPTIFPNGDGNTGIYFSTADTVNTAVGGVNAFQVCLVTGRTVGTLRSVETGATGPSLILWHDSVSPAISDTAAVIAFQSDSGGSPYVVGQIYCLREAVDSAAMSSSFVFSVQNLANATNVNVSATLTTLGVWTDASSAAIKTYEGDMDGVTDKLKSLSTLGVYRGKNAAVGSEKHYSPTAEDFHKIFGLGDDKGIAAKDVGWLGVKAVLELEARVAALENK